MRVSSNQQMHNLQQYISRASEQMTTLQEQVSSGKRIKSPSDDPLGYANLISMRSSIAKNKQYQRNIGAAKDTLNTSESTLNEVTKLMQEVKQITISGANGTKDQSARDALVIQVDSAMTHLISLVNGATVNGRYIFSGQKTSTTPLTTTITGVTYNGDALPLKIEVSVGQTMQVNLPGSPIFTDIYSTLKTIRDDLSSGNLSNLSGPDLASVQSLTNNVLTARAGIGGQLKELDALENQTSRRNDDLTKFASNIEDVDIVQAISDLSAAQNSYQASLTVASNTFGMSLMDFIRGG